jgi:hypothetical protein
MGAPPASLQRVGPTEYRTSAYAGVDPTLEGRALQDALGVAVATRGGSCSWDVDHAGWVVTLSSPERQEFYGRTLEEALACSLVLLMAKGTGHPKGLDWGHELGIGPFCRMRHGSNPTLPGW